MNKPTLFFILGAFLATPAMATTFSSSNVPFSQYGQIQNVQSYSSNPFWNPNSPYNQTMPVPIYATGTDVSTSDCTAVVGALVSSFCATRNNCVGMDVNDARPTLIVQLASLPNHNYVTPCAGYIDTEFDKYKSQNAVAAPTGKVVAFPTATTPNANTNNQKYQFQNPANPQLPTWNGEPWAQEILNRENELKNLQSGNNPGLVRADFPKTADDLTFTQRTQLDAAGYEPYKDAIAYNQLKISDKNVTQTTKTNDDTMTPEQRADFIQRAGDMLDDLKDLGKVSITKKKETSGTTSNLSSTLASCQNAATDIKTCVSYLSPYAMAQLEYLPTGIKQLTNWDVTPVLGNNVVTDPVTGNKLICENYETYEQHGKKIFCGTERKGGDIIYGHIRICDNGWQDNCVPGYCDDEIEPVPGTESMLKWAPDPANICWHWDCPDGYTKLATGQCATEFSIRYLYGNLIKQLESDSTGQSVRQFVPNL